MQTVKKWKTYRCVCAYACSNWTFDCKKNLKLLKLWKTGSNSLLNTNLNFFMHKSHWNGRSPVCVRMCTSRYGLRQNAASQTLLWKRSKDREKWRIEMNKLLRVAFPPFTFSVGHTYSPYKQMASFLNATSYARSSCWQMTTFYHKLCTLAVCCVCGWCLFVTK